MSRIKLNNIILNMSIREDIKSILARENVTMQSIAEKLNSSVQNLSNKLRSKTIKFEEVREIADILGYDIEFKKRNL